MKINFKALIISILISLGVGGLSALITGGSMDMYNMLVKPPLSPPGIVFPIVWTILYILMGISAYIIYKSRDISKKEALKIYAIQLLINFIWPILFFKLEWLFPSFIWILILLGVIILMISKFYKIDKTAAYLQIPYLLWVIFATYLNFSFYILNR